MGPDDVRKLEHEAHDYGESHTLERPLPVCGRCLRVFPAGYEEESCQWKNLGREAMQHKDTFFEALIQGWVEVEHHVEVRRNDSKPKSVGDRIKQLARAGVSVVRVDTGVLTARLRE